MEDDLTSQGFLNNEVLLVGVDLTRLPKVESDSKELSAEKNKLRATNTNCNKAEATVIQKQYVKADGNCLFNCATLALQNTVDHPQETREILASIMLSDPVTFTA